MNQKNLIVLLVVIILVLTGAVGYFMITKNALPQSQNKDVSQNNQNQQIQVSKNTTPQANNLTKIDELGIEAEFLEGYDITKSEGKTIILFGPVSTANFGPDPAQEMKPYHIYELQASPKLSSDEIIAGIKKNNPAEELITVKPEVKSINNLTIVKWAEGGMCENRAIEVVGPKNNYIFSSLGCHQEQKFDFDYFEKTIKTIKFL
jgi:hypothetical protein